jgi:hypothetical protein
VIFNFHSNIYTLARQKCDEEEDDEDVLSRETVRLLWHPNGSETVEEEKKVNLYCLILKILLNFFNIFYQICVSEHFVCIFLFMQPF